MWKPKTKETEKLAKLISALPAVQQLVAEERQRTVDAQHKERSDCIARVQSLSVKEEAAKKALDAAVDRLEQQRKTLGKLESEVIAAEEEWRAVSADRSHADRDLLLRHGEGQVQRALFRLQRMREDLEARIKGLNENLHENFMVGGKVFSRRVRPDVAQRLREEEERLSAVEKASADAGQLVMVDLPPSEITQRVELLLLGVGVNSHETEEGVA